MILSPTFILQEKILKPIDGFPLSENQIQTNGIDVTVCKIHELSDKFVLYKNEEGREEKILPKRKKILPNSNGLFELKAGIPYSVDCYERVCIPEGVVAIIYGRSTLNRNGILIRSGLYDSGFRNTVGFTVYPWVSADIQQGTRIAQIIFLEAEYDGKLYEGQYQGK